MVTIHSLSGDVVELAPRLAEVVAVPLESGSDGSGHQLRFVRSYGDRLTLLTPQNCPWPYTNFHPHDRVWALEPPDGRLQYEYGYAPKSGAVGALTREDVTAGVQRCLTAVGGMSFHSLAVPLVQAVHGTSRKGSEAETAKAITAAVRRSWEPVFGFWGMEIHLIYNAIRLFGDEEVA